MYGSLGAKNRKILTVNTLTVNTLTVNTLTVMEREVGHAPVT